MVFHRSFAASRRQRVPRFNTLLTYYRPNRLILWEILTFKVVVPLLGDRGDQMTGFSLN